MKQLTGGVTINLGCCLDVPVGKVWVSASIALIICCSCHLASTPAAFFGPTMLLLQVVIADTVKAHLQERQERLQQIDALRDKVNALAVAFDQRWDDD